MIEAVRVSTAQSADSFNEDRCLIAFRIIDSIQLDNMGTHAAQHPNEIAGSARHVEHLPVDIQVGRVACRPAYTIRLRFNEGERCRIVRRDGQGTSCQRSMSVSACCCVIAAHSGNQEGVAHSLKGRFR